MPSDKANHVRNAGQTRSHTCHWPGCNKEVPPAKWGCYKHWWQLPSHLRRRIWQTYVIGQEEDLSKVSPEYISVATEVQKWIRGYLIKQAVEKRGQSNVGKKKARPS